MFHINIFITMVLVMVGSISAQEKEQEAATFAGGCFWCMEQPFEEYDGVISATSGYTGGEKENPSYEEVSSGKTRHLEAVQVIFDPSIMAYSELLEIFWRQIDPTDAGGQFVDRGNHYKTAIFYHSEEQKKLAEASKKALQASKVFKKPIVTVILPAKNFFKAEEYHQNYYKKSSIPYKSYRSHSGRDDFIEEHWKEGLITSDSKDSEVILEQRLSDLQYHVTRENGTEPPFQNEYWNLKEEGIYVEIISGEPLFSSTDKFVSGTGWPSFVRPLDENNLVEVKDRSLWSVRIEVRSKVGDSHLGHLFDDGPEPTGLRYCINSAALRFIPKDHLEEEGFAKYLHLFD